MQITSTTVSKSNFCVDRKWSAFWLRDLGTAQLHRRMKRVRPKSHQTGTLYGGAARSFSVSLRLRSSASCWAIAFACIRRNPMLPLQQPPPPALLPTLSSKWQNKQTRRPKLLFSFLFLNYWRPERILIVLFLDRIIFLFIQVTLFFLNG